ncbi:hypothetical protein BDQ12DRAFT_677249 [Crucibulum laeve]|uniref:RING-type domain-containing protein n=1 Tax=Crucibulum laeve TaxID=68775 RepID=A0A5C3M8U4_9AGAR|nr:hypothetical protein BDQ12DRAFT_677249 [Crucibulum laeve]
MSDREPLWFCHECHSEMRPLMAPDPVCASCHGSFVEKMENPADDPREFAHTHNEDPERDGLPPALDTFLMSLQSLMERGIAQAPRTQNETGSAPRMTFEVRGGNGTRVVRLGGTNTLNNPSLNTVGAEPANIGAVPTMSEFLRRNPNEGQNGPTITGPLMAQYLMALLGQNDPLSALFAGGLGGGLPENGRMGDYVFNQEALDQIITQLMENSNAHRPVPATEEIIANLPREVLVEGSAMLEKDCAVCKEQFKLETEDPDEQIVITLPCKHPFHDPCILPWLKSSGTCPVCRYQLVPQPEHHGPPTGPTQDSGGSRQASPGSNPPQRDRGDHGGLFHAILQGFTGGSNTGTSRATGATNNGRHQRSNSDPPHSSRNGSNSNLPGGWTEDLD